MRDEDVIQYTVADGVGRLILNRPATLNALNVETFAALRRIVTDAALDSAVRAVLITGAGRAFCAGGDVKDMLAEWLTASTERPPEVSVVEGAGELHQAISTIYRMPKPVICAVNGPSAGAGVGLALAGDIVWAARSATFKLAYTAIGLSPDGGTTFALARAVGPKLATELLLTNRQLNAEEALSVGLISRVLADDELLPAAEAMASELAQGATVAYAEVKALVRSSWQSGLETQLENERQGVTRCATTSDLMEGVRAFVEKRRPAFKGR